LRLARGVASQGGTDAGDHPPITPVRPATEEELGGGDSWRVYDYVARHFLASVSPDAVFRRTRCAFEAGGEAFSAAGSVCVRAGFIAVMPWKVRRAVGGAAAVPWLPSRVSEYQALVVTGDTVLIEMHCAGKVCTVSVLLVCVHACFGGGIA
jgi:DNA topoisomerase